jgi:hypothetical protein
MSAASFHIATLRLTDTLGSTDTVAGQADRETSEFTGPRTNLNAERDTALTF